MPPRRSPRLASFSRPNQPRPDAGPETMLRWLRAPRARADQRLGAMLQHQVAARPRDPRPATIPQHLAAARPRVDPRPASLLQHPVAAQPRADSRIATKLRYLA